jgi:UDP-glucose 4-epimerase
LAGAVKSLLGADNEIRVIGTRHGEKLFETLLTREEFAKAEDLGSYYRIPADNRTLNYAQYFTEGQTVEEHEYNSHNTEILGIDGVKQILLKLPIIREAML